MGSKGVDKDTLSVSMVVYGHSYSDIYLVLDSFYRSCINAGIFYPKVTIIDNKGNFDFNSLLTCFNNEYSYMVDNLDYISSPHNPGYSASNNLVIMNSTSKYHLVINPDVIMGTASLGHAITRLENEPDCILVTPKIFNENDELISGIKKLPSFFTLLLRFLNNKLLNNVFRRRLENYEYRDRLSSNVGFKVQIASGCCMLCRTSDLTEVGGFDETFFLYFEDFDLSIRIRSRGYIIYDPLFEIKHFGGNTGRKGIRHIIYFLSSMIKFMYKYGFRIV